MMNPEMFTPDNGESWILELVRKEIRAGNVEYIINKMHMIGQAKENGYVSTIGVALREKYYYDENYGAFQNLKVISLISYWFGERFDNMTLYKREI